MSLLQNEILQCLYSPQPWVSVYCLDWRSASTIAIHNVDRLVQRQLRVDGPVGTVTHDNLEIAKALFA